MNDDIVFGRLGSLYRVRADGGEQQLLVERDSAAGIIRYGAPHFLPEGKVVLAERLTSEGSELVSVRLSDGEVTDLGIAGYAPHYVDDGLLVYVDQDGAAFAVRFDADRARAQGTPTRLAENVIRSAHARISVSRNGTIAYLSSVGTDQRDVIMVNRDGTRRLVPVPPGRYRFPRLSPDGSKLAIVAQAPRRVTGDVWTYEFTTQRADQLTFDSTALLAEWAPDGRSIIYTARQAVEAGQFQLYRVASSGGAARESLFFTPRGVSTPALTPDSRTLVYSTIPEGGDWNVLVAPVGDPGAVRPLADAPNYNETGVSLSPDGRWVAYAANPGGTWQVYVRRLEGGASRWLVSTTRGGTEPRWGVNGRELYREGDSLRVASFNAVGDTPVIGSPRALFEERYLSWPTEVHYDVTRDGQRFVFVSGSQGNISLSIVLNRLDHLRARNP